MLTLPTLSQWPGMGKIWSLRQDIWHEASYLRQPGVGERYHSSPESIRMQPGSDRRIDELSFGGIAACARGSYPLSPNPREQLLRQPRLTDTHFPRQYHQMRPSHCRVLPGHL